ncbi:pentapeptide repeat-containing protein [Streptomyces sp. NPDC003832]
MCLAHLADTECDAYLTGLTPGTSIDHRGTTFSKPLLNALLAALRDPATGHPRIGDARFESATFQGSALFDSARFRDDALFDSVTFQGGARFWSVTFHAGVWFGSAAFEHDAVFGSATFEGDVRFELATFGGDAVFGSATFKEGIQFESATFHGDLRFEQAVFERVVGLGPVVCAGRVVLSGALFGGPVTLSFAARRLDCRRTRWSATVEVRLRHATVDFSHAVFEYPLTIAAEARPFVRSDGQPVVERALAYAPDTPDAPDGSDAAVRVASLRGVDAAHLVLADVDLSGCLFTGTVHLDHLRLEGACSLDTVPPRTLPWRPARFTQRRTLAEEHHWRASQPAADRGWNVAVLGAGRVGPPNWRLCIGPCARRSRTARTSRGQRTSTTARWRCAATTPPAPCLPGAGP